MYRFFSKEGWNQDSRYIETTCDADIEPSGLCDDGLVIEMVTLACIVCDLGRHSAPDSRDSFSCSAGRFGDAAGSSLCGSCPFGKFQNVTGASACNVCPAGTYCPMESARLLDCRPGSFSNDLEEAELCSTCPPGEYQGSIRVSACEPCVGLGRITQYPGSTKRL
jgi:hypothetical protein